MIEDIAKNIVHLKQEFSKIYDGTSHIQEVIPSSPSDLFPIDKEHLKLLHQFAKNNPIYYNSYKQEIMDISCIVYEGDINKYWLNSIQYGSSHAPFSPTWILSAYVNALLAKHIGCTEIIDIGSGDGRIAYCGTILNLKSYSIEIDEMLVELQKSLITILDFHPFCSDAVKFDYSSLQLSKPAFFIGGLAQMGGLELASGVLKKVNSILKNIYWIFAGTISQKYASDPKNYAGWGTLMGKNNLKHVQTILLPTVWTFHETDDTPYVFTKSF
jgi:hypothetical protein